VCDVLNAFMLWPLQVGEVWVRGPTVFAGYWGLPAATAESFAEGDWFK
jgi:fatty-acyl-CoA synthase